MRIPSLALALATIAAPAAADITVSPDLVSKVQPHRAIYSLKAKTVSNTGGVADAGGAIAYELTEECGRWLTKHTFLLTIVKQDAKERAIRTDYTSWEAKDGLSFGFEVQPRVLYEYANPGLEARSAGQKALLRLGPEGERAAKAKLREIRRALTAVPAR